MRGERTKGCRDIVRTERCACLSVVSSLLFDDGFVVESSTSDIFTFDGIVGLGTIDKELSSQYRFSEDTQSKLKRTGGCC